MSDGIILRQFMFVDIDFVETRGDKRDRIGDEVERISRIIGTYSLEGMWLYLTLLGVSIGLVSMMQSTALTMNL